MIKHLIKIANKLDSKGLVSEADSLDAVVNGLLKYAGSSDLPESFMSEYNSLSAEEKAAVGNMIVQDSSVPFGFSGDPGTSTEGGDPSSGGSWEAPYEPGGSILWSEGLDEDEEIDSRRLDGGLTSALDSARQHQLLTSAEVDQFKEISREETSAREESRSEMSLWGKTKDSLGLNLPNWETGLMRWIERVLHGEVSYDDFQRAKQQMLSDRSTNTDNSPQGWQW